MALSRDGSADASTSQAAILRADGEAAHPSQPLPLPSSVRTNAPMAPLPNPGVAHMGPPPVLANKLRLIPPQLHSMVAGAGAGLISSIATCPLDVVKTTLQAQSRARGDKNYEGVTKTVVRIYRQSGLRGFYRGLGPTIGGYLPTWAIYFTVYDFAKDRLRRVPLAVAHPDLSHVAAAMTAGATGTILTNPLWVVKTRFMVSERRRCSCCRWCFAVIRIGDVGD